VGKSLLKPILIADDRPSDVEAIRQFVREAGIQNPLQTVSNGVDVMDYLLGKEPYADRDLYACPTILFLDLVMPFKSGLDVLRWIRSRNEPEIRSIGVVAMTGMGNLDEIREAYQCGAHSFLVKPVVKEDFMNLIQGLKGIQVRPATDGVELNFDTGIFSRQDLRTDGGLGA
jgi:CheY-like chemotaxis protein